MINSGCERILDYAFTGCVNLKKFILPDTVSFVGKQVLAECNSLKNLDVHFFGESKTDTDYNRLSYYFEKYVGDNSAITASLESTKFRGDQNISSTTFSNLKSLKNLEILGKTQTIEKGSFAGLSSLESLTIPFVGESATALNEKALLGYAFGDASYEGSYLATQTYSLSLSTAKSYMPKNLNYIKVFSGNFGFGAFCNAVSLKRVETTADNVTLSDRVFYNCVNLENINFSEKVSSIGSYCFFGCAKLSAFTLNSAITSIPDYAFANCSSLGEMDLSNLISIGKSAFALTSLSTVNILKTVNLGESAFQNCANLKTVTLPSTITKIKGNPFAYCSSLESIALSGDNANYLSGENCIIDKTDGRVIIGCKNSVLPTDNTAKSIGAYAFAGAVGLTKISLPSSITLINNDAFIGCDNIEYNKFGNGLYLGNDINPYLALQKVEDKTLNYLTINDDTFLLDNHLFDGYSMLANLTIGKNIQTIHATRFEDCLNLSNIQVSSENLTFTTDGYSLFDGSSKTILLGGILSAFDGIKNIGDNAFKGRNLQTLVVPENVKSIGCGAFEGCPLNSATLPFIGAGVEVESGDHFGYIFGALTYSSNKVKVPSTLKTVTITGFGSRDRVIYGHAFYECVNVENVTIPSNTATIRVSAFDDCKKLFAFTIPSGVFDLGDKAFYSCTSLTEIVIPSSVKNIGRSAFSICSKLARVTFDVITNWEVDDTSSFVTPASLKSATLSDTSASASYLTTKYSDFYWRNVG